jgi:hypothetical protein
MNTHGGETMVRELTLVEKVLLERILAFLKSAGFSTHKENPFVVSVAIDLANENTEGPEKRADKWIASMANWPYDTIPEKLLDRQAAFEALKDED